MINGEADNARHHLSRPRDVRKDKRCPPKKCKQCGKEVSTEADFCPHCGVRTKTKIGCLGAVGIVLGVLVLIVLLTGLLMQNPEKQTPPSQPTAREIEANRQIEENYLKTPAGKLWQKHKDWDRRFCDSIVRRKVLQGMSPGQVRAAWGRPENINRTVIPGHTSEQWVYGDTYLYFDDGVLTSWQESR